MGARVSCLFVDHNFAHTQNLMITVQQTSQLLSPPNRAFRITSYTCHNMQALQNMLLAIKSHLVNLGDLSVNEFAVAVDWEGVSV